MAGAAVKAKGEKELFHLRVSLDCWPFGPEGHDANLGRRAAHRLTAIAAFGSRLRRRANCVRTPQAATKDGNGITHS
jgi:hypothetical protein